MGYGVVRDRVFLIKIKTASFAKQNEVWPELLINPFEDVTTG